MSLILPSLYIGTMYDAHNQNLMAKIGITHIVSVHESAAPFDNRYQFLCIIAADLDKENLSKYFSTVNDFVHQGRSKGCVFIHCVVGRSRSVTFAVAYIMTVTSLPFADALTIVRERRPVANPNEGFCKQLQHYNFNQEIIRFRNKFDKKFDRFNDVLECRNILSFRLKSKEADAAKTA